MRNRLDGIKTKDGRVIYDRPKHSFSQKDVTRILEKFNAELEDPSQIDVCESLSIYMAGLVSALRRSFGTSIKEDCVSAAVSTLEMLKDTVMVMEETFEGFGGGTFGGAGASN